MLRWLVTAAMGRVTLTVEKLAPAAVGIVTLMYGISATSVTPIYRVAFRCFSVRYVF